MTTYSIIAETNSFIAQRDSMFNGHTEVVLKSNLSLKEAYRELLDMYNNCFEDSRSYARNWGLAVIQSARHIDGASNTHADGTRSFTYDSRMFRIEEEETEE